MELSLLQLRSVNCMRRSSSTEKYDCIKVLEEVEHIRLRPGMYVGSVETPLHLIYEVLDNALDEANAGSATEIRVKLTKESCEISDNGRGFPLYNINGVPAPVVACTKLFSGGKFDRSSYHVSIGLNGVGLVAVCALSSKMTLATTRITGGLVAEFSQGKVVSYSSTPGQSTTGTTVTFSPDPQIFRSTDLLHHCLHELTHRIRLALTVMKDLKIWINDELITPYQYRDLVSSSVDTELCVCTLPDHTCLIIGYSSRLSSEDLSHGAVNLLPVDRGTHIAVARRIIIQAWEQFIAGRVIKPADVLIGCSSFCSVFLSNPQYTSQVKDTLSNSITEFSSVSEQLVRQFSKFLSSHEDLRTRLIKKFEDYRESLNRLDATAYLDSILNLGDVAEGNVSRRLSAPKLIDCSSTSVKDTELFIVEGESAAGSLRHARDKRYHAILPLRGKILNIVDREIQSVMDNEEVRSIINGVGAGAYHRSDIRKIRYGKIIIMSDSDYDGMNIRALVIGLFAYAMPEVINSGHLYFVEAPLYGYYEQGQWVPHYEMTPPPVSSYQRFKGLGEMNSNEIKEVAFNEKYRRLVRLVDADKEIVRLVGGSFLKRKLLIDRGLINEQTLT